MGSAVDIIKSARIDFLDENKVSFSDSILVNYLNRGTEYVHNLLVANDVEMAQREQVITTVASTESALLPEDYWGTAFLFVNGAIAPLGKMNQTEYFGMPAASYSGQPLLYLIKNNRLYFRPVPDDAYTIYHRYYQKFYKFTEGPYKSTPSWTFAEIIPNGDMEVDSGWSAVLTPTVNALSTTQVRAGRYSRKITTDAVNEGIKTSVFTSVGTTAAPITYRVRFWAYRDTANTALTITVRKGDDSGAYTVKSAITGVIDTWCEHVVEWTETLGGAAAYFQITLDTAGTVYFDDIYSAMMPWEGLFDQSIREFVSMMALNRDEYTIENEKAIYGALQQSAMKIIQARQPEIVLDPFAGGGYDQWQELFGRS